MKTMEIKALKSNCWNKVWSKKYQMLTAYYEKVRIHDYAPVLQEMMTRLRGEYGCNYQRSYGKGKNKQTGRGAVHALGILHRDTPIKDIRCPPPVFPAKFLYAKQSVRN